MAESYYRKRMRRLLAEGFTPSQARGHPKPGEPSVRRVRASAAAEGRSVRSWLAAFFTASPDEWRDFNTPLRDMPDSQLEAIREGATSSGVRSAASRELNRRGRSEPVRPPPIEIVPPELLLPPEDRGFVTGPVFDNPFEQKAYDFGFVDDQGETIDEYGASLLYQGWFDFQGMDPFDLAMIRDDFFAHTDYTWRDFDDWREYISEYLGAA